MAPDVFVLIILEKGTCF